MKNWERVLKLFAEFGLDENPKAFWASMGRYSKAQIIEAMQYLMGFIPKKQLDHILDDLENEN